MGQWKPDDEVMVRVHEPLSMLDLLDADSALHSWSIRPALARIQKEGIGAAVLLNCGESGTELLERVTTSPGQLVAAKRWDPRIYGTGAQILRELGITRMKLLGSPRRMPSMAGYGLEITGFVSPGH